MVNEIVTLKSPNMILAGAGALNKMGEEAKVLEAKSALMVTDKGIMDSGIGRTVEAILKTAGLAVDIFDSVESDPTISCSIACTDMAKAGDYDIIVGVGGGSSMDIACVASVMCTNPGSVHDYFGVNLLKKPGKPTFLVATTAGTGAEVTPNAILTDIDEKLKKGIVSSYILPRLAVIDPNLMLSMPPRVTSFTGMDALCHTIESYTSTNATSLTDMYAETAIEWIGRSLRTAVAKGSNLKARNDMAMGSLYAGISLANAGVTAVHAMAYPLGGEFNVPHGIANGLLLPYVMEFNIMGDIPKFARVAALMGERVEGLSLLDQARLSANSVKNLVQDIDMPKSLSELNIPADAIPRMSEAALNVTRLMGNNPRNMTREDVEQVFNNSM